MVSWTQITGVKLLLRVDMMTKLRHTILVLNNGESWTDEGHIAEVSDEAYKLLCDGVKPKHLKDSNSFKVKKTFITSKLTIERK